MRASVSILRVDLAWDDLFSAILSASDEFCPPNPFISRNRDLLGITMIWLKWQPIEMISIERIRRAEMEHY